MAESETESCDDTRLKPPLVEVTDLAMEEITCQARGNEVEDSETDDQSNVEDGAEEDDEPWESDSLYEDVFEGLGDGEGPNGDVEQCTSKEAAELRKLLREVGEDEFIMQTLEDEHNPITAKKLCSAFGVHPPSIFEGAPDSAYYPLLGLGIKRELSKRVKLEQWNTIDDAVTLLKKSQNIIVVTGAGISTSLGIPDFRSKDTGLYSQLEHLGLSDPQEVFDINVFRHDPTIFYSVAKDILPATKKFSPTHAFIRLLQDKNKLLTNFTQNIDNIEDHAGIAQEKLIQCHGSFATATCQECLAQVNGEDLYAEIKAGMVPHCKACARRLQRTGPFGMKRKRSSNGLGKAKRRADYEDSTDEDDYDIAAAGVMKPDITFFGEDLPAKFHDRLVKHDRDLVDLVIVIGTSMKVAPVADVPNFLPPKIPQIFISRDPCRHIPFDIELLGDCDVVVAELCKRTGWDLKHEMVPDDVKVEALVNDDCPSRWHLASSKPLKPPEPFDVESRNSQGASQTLAEKARAVEKTTIFD